MLRSERIAPRPGLSRGTDQDRFLARLLAGARQAMSGFLGVPALRCRRCGTHMEQLDSRVTHWDGYFAVSTHYWLCPDCGERAESDHVVTLAD